jgi:hypothetical protein
MRHGGLAVPSGGGPGSVDLSHTVAAGRAHRSDRMASADLPLMPMSGCYSGRVNVGTRHRRRGRPALQPASTASIHRGRQPRAHIRIERANDDDTEGASRSRSTLFTRGISSLACSRSTVSARRSSLALNVAMLSCNTPGPLLREAGCSCGLCSPDEPGAQVHGLVANMISTRSRLTDDYSHSVGLRNGLTTCR